MIRYEQLKMVYFQLIFICGDRRVFRYVLDHRQVTVAVSDNITAPSLNLVLICIDTFQFWLKLVNK